MAAFASWFAVAGDGCRDGMIYSEMIRAFGEPLGFGWRCFFAFSLFSFFLLKKKKQLIHSRVCFTCLSVQYVIIGFYHEAVKHAMERHFTSMYAFEDSYIQENANNVPYELLGMVRRQKW